MNGNNGDRGCVPFKKADWKDWAAWLFIFAMAAAIPGGLVAAWYWESGWPSLISVIAFIFFAAGGL